MRLLFDTHIFLWAVANDPKLSVRARNLISAADEVFVSSASIWEVAIKAAKGKLDVDVDRLLVAQAWCEPLLLVAADGHLSQYGASRILTV